MTIVALVTWFAPSLTAASTNMLFRFRGELDTRGDVVIVAIDDNSLQRVGRWPWPRAVIADAIDKISAAQPRAIGIDIIFAERSDTVADKRLAEAIENSGKVVLPAQLLAKEGIPDEEIVWLRPVFDSVAALGHAHVSPDVDGTLRAIQLSKADDGGKRLWAFGLEVLRVAEGLSATDFEERATTLRFGSYEIPLRFEEPFVSQNDSIKLNRSNEMLINYAGPAASFRRYSIVDVLQGQLPAKALDDKIVLLGAVATSMSDIRVTPFMHYGTDLRQGAQEMPGVEVHANVINTIRRGLWLKPVPESWAFLIALGIIFLTTAVISKLDGWLQIIVLSMILLGILIGSFLAFKVFFVVPPVPGMLLGFATSIPLLLNRTLNASRRLDLKIEALASTQKGFLLDDTRKFEDRSAWLKVPRNLTWKLRAVDEITERLVARMNFMDRVLSGMGEGVVVADASGRVVFANREAAEAFGISADKLMSSSFAEFLIEHKVLDQPEYSEALKRTGDGQVFQKDFTIQHPARKHYVLQLSSIMAPAEPEGLQTIGLVALMFDTTRRVELEQMRGETLQLVSHELRTPLTSIQGLSDVLLKFSVDNSQAREMVATIHSEALRLSQTINRYLDLARLESGAQPLKIANVKLRELVAESVRRHQAVAANRNIRIVQELEPGLAGLAADGEMLAQALNNLVSNAVKYAPKGSVVTIQTSSENGHVLLGVRDQGPGISPEHHQRVFEKFYRMERDESSGVVGTGLGLSLVKEIVERHQGKIRLESIPNEGSTFTLVLPHQPGAKGL